MMHLHVLVDGDLIGTLSDTQPLAFTYSDDCLAGRCRSPFAAVIALQAGPIATPAVQAYFENLLPEGDQRRALEQLHHTSSVFGLLSKAGWDTAGAVVLRRAGAINARPAYRAKSWADIAKIIAGQALQQGTSRVSISGAQYKLLLSLDERGQALLPVGSTPSTHILKPDIQRTGQKIWASAINETIVMRAAAKCGLPVANVDYVSAVKSCLVQRFDRRVRLGSVERIAQADLCQLLNLPSRLKYEAEGGPGFAACYACVKALSTQPLVDCDHLIQWIFFNLYVGNHDGHAKNLSMLQDGAGYRLAPFYDLMCTSIYPGFSREFSFRIGTTFKPGSINPNQLQRFAASLGVSDKLLRKHATAMAEKLPFAVQQSILELRPVMGPGEATLADRLQFEVAGLCKKRLARLLGTAPGQKAPAHTH